MHNKTSDDLLTALCLIRFSQNDRFFKKYAAHLYNHRVKYAVASKHEADDVVLFLGQPLYGKLIAPLAEETQSAGSVSNFETSLNTTLYKAEKFSADQK